MFFLREKAKENKMLNTTKRPYCLHGLDFAFVVVPANTEVKHGSLIDQAQQNSANHPKQVSEATWVD